eukprot:PhF_6_TR1026/c0_g1_i1/m.2074
MFTFIKSATNVLSRDLQEFANTIAKDTQEVLHVVDPTIKYCDAPEGSALRRLQEDSSTYTLPIPVLGNEGHDGATNQAVEVDWPRVLSQCPLVSQAYDRYVPNNVSEEEFWRRYKYRVDALCATSAQGPSNEDDDWATPSPVIVNGGSTNQQTGDPQRIVELQKEISILRKENETLKSRVIRLESQLAAQSEKTGNGNGKNVDEGGAFNSSPIQAKASNVNNKTTPSEQQPAGVGGDDEWADLGEWK